MSDAQKLTELLGGCWHEKDNINYPYVLCKKCKEFYRGNPSYTHADEVLVPLRKKLGEEKYAEFIFKLSTEPNILDKSRFFTVFNFIDTYILNVPALVKKAIEFLKQMKGE